MNALKTNYRIIGMMSGTSLDGIDIALCRFKAKKDRWDFQIERAQTFPYSEDWVRQLSTAEHLTGLDLMLLHNNYGKYIGDLLLSFMENSGQIVDFISSHGHTVFHQPNNKLTFQIGNSAVIAAITGKPVVADFRSTDVALGGQGAPLVPIGDKLLFNEFDYCLNLGGFANISFDNEEKNRVAFDICPVNIVLNFLVRGIGLSYDYNGNLGRAGKLHPELVTKLNEIPYYHSIGPKSLGKEWVEQHVIPILNLYNNLSIEDKLAAFYHHIAIQIEKSIRNDKCKKLLITGGGAYNIYLIELIQKRTNMQIVIPEKNIIDFKEALIFAFLGLLRYNGEINCLSSVTGSSADHSAGLIYAPNLISCAESFKCSNNN